MPDLLDCPVGLLIGYDCPRALKPTQVISGKDHEPYAVKTDSGWSIVGSIAPNTCSRNVKWFCHRISVKELPVITPASIIRTLEADFQDTDTKEKTISQEDIQFLQQLDERVQQDREGRVEMPLFFREHPQLPNNKQLATIRLKHLKRKLEQSPKYREDYVRFMDSVFRDGDAEEATATPKEGLVHSAPWSVPSQEARKNKSVI